ncbi:MAG TPA: chromate transporter, partial [Candidatus Baltobacteraceae bacterium]|nr:chromate transporter [Candidatus Baltobacteraceae bacterium]
GIIPQMHRDVVINYQWLSNTQFTQFYTIGKLVPGPTTIFAALIGYAAMPGRPLLGALVATIGMFVPSSILMVLADVFWERFSASPWRPIVAHGLAPAIVGLVWASVWTISRGTATGVLPYAIAGVVAFLTLRTKLSAPLLIAVSGVVGIIALR